MNFCVVNDDREEGEIVEDDFEDISDTSITEPLYIGKSVSAKEHLRALSLSSISENELKPTKKVRVRRKSHLKRKRAKHEHKLEDIDSDDSLEVNKSLQNQLKTAVRIESDELHKNSLRTRLKAMTNQADLGSSSDAVLLSEEMSIASDCEDKEKDPLTEAEPEPEPDIELIELRAEALRTAVLNKFAKKKKKVKSEGENDSNKSENETNKENHQTNIIEDKKEEKKDVSVIEEDEDVLRALLLASMSKKITKDDAKTEIQVLPQPPAPNQNNNGIKPVTMNNYNKKNTPNKPLIVPTVKPLIININPDSESDDDLSFIQETKKTEPEKKVNLVPADFENTLEKFLKEQRTKVEAKQLNVVQKTPILEKSAVKLLPKVKQLEYQKLLLRLKNAEKKPRIRKASHRITEVKNGVKKVTRTRIVTGSKVGEARDFKSDILTLHRTLKAIQVPRNGRLQIQEKYAVLAPHVKKINEANANRKKNEQLVKQLLEQLAEAKKSLLISQEAFSTCVKQLVYKKELLDKSFARPQAKVQQRFTSTPIKDVKKEGFSVSSEEPKEDRIISVGDPNDVYKLIGKETETELTGLKYTSPLDAGDRKGFDPLGILCPFEVAGSCRDADCKYNHL